MFFINVEGIYSQCLAEYEQLKNIFNYKVYYYLEKFRFNFENLRDNKIRVSRKEYPHNREKIVLSFLIECFWRVYIRFHVEAS